MKALKLSLLLSLAAVFCASATDYTPITINVAGTVVSGNTAQAASVSTATLLAKINAYLGINGAKLAIDNTNGDVVVLDKNGALLKDLSMDDNANNYNTNKNGIQLYVYASTYGWQYGDYEYTSGMSNPGAQVYNKVNILVRQPHDTFFIEFENDYDGWQTDFEMGTWGGPIANLMTSRTAAGVYTFNYSGTVSGYINFYTPQNNYYSGHTSGTFSVIGTSTVPYSIWDPTSTF